MIVEIYSKPNCLYCNKAKALLESKNINYLEYVIGKHIDAEDVRLRYPTMRTVPIILIDYQLVGGYTELNERLQNDERKVFLAE